ncbi:MULTISPECIES: hypothetical protein [Providencia]|uniref:hypothetical protein n=1 Tax=Providencia TaxID=586 RepID=UPI000D961984|nr:MULTISPECIES: hypothetical protein [Providencia]MTC26408.1 hypothetical protein [Providencia alcalifaciens]SPY67998.1 Uncharacterised protein [Providencia alcalifaciens]
MKKINYAILVGIVALIVACKSPVTVSHNPCDGMFTVTKNNGNFEFKQQDCLKK